MKDDKGNVQQPFIPAWKKRNPKWCKTCMFSHGESPFENSPEKAYCEIYTRADGIEKPDSVYFDGGECEFYEKEE